VVISGKVRLYRGRLQMESPEFEPIDADLLHTGRMVPVYPATQGLGQKTLRRIVKTAIDAVGRQVPDPIPEWVQDERRLPSAVEALNRYHYPASQEEAEASRQRLALGEFVAIQAAVLMRRAQWQDTVGAPHLDMGESLATRRSTSSS
jgi:ATP-dependent DNA helicase RecG